MWPLHPHRGGRHSHPQPDRIAGALLLARVPPGPPTAGAAPEHERARGSSTTEAATARCPRPKTPARRRASPTRHPPASSPRPRQERPAEGRRPSDNNHAARSVVPRRGASFQPAKRGQFSSVVDIELLPPFGALRLPLVICVMLHFSSLSFASYASSERLHSVAAPAMWLRWRAGKTSYLPSSAQRASTIQLMISHGAVRTPSSGPSALEPELTFDRSGPLATARSRSIPNSARLETSVQQKW